MNMKLKIFCLGFILCWTWLLMCGCGSKNEEKKDFLTELQEQKIVLNAEEVLLTTEETQEFNVRTYLIRYQSEGCEVEAYISVPKEYLEAQGKYSCMVYNRGGNRDYGANSPELIAYLADSSKMIVAASQYRGTSGSTGEDEFGGEDVMDIINLIDICENISIIDMDRFYMLGSSRGGMMTYQVIRQDSRINKAVVLSGVADLFDMYEARADMKPVLKELVGGTPEELPEEYEKRSATHWADELLCPVLIIHSKLDERVPYVEAEKMAECLEAASKEYKFISYEDDVHGFHPEDFEIIMEWFGQ